MTNLFLAIVWLALAIVMFAWPWFTGEPGWNTKIKGTDISAAWLILALCGFNLVRWWSGRSYQKEQRELQIRQALLARRHHHHPEPIGDPDPNFDFTSEPPPPPRPNITDQPPSPN